MSAQFPSTPVFPTSAASISASDGATFSASAIYVGTGGSVVVTPADGGADVTFTNVPSGSVLPLTVIAVKNTGTSASGFIRVW